MTAANGPVWKEYKTTPSIRTHEDTEQHNAIQVIQRKGLPQNILRLMGHFQSWYEQNDMREVHVTSMISSMSTTVSSYLFLVVIRTEGNVRNTQNNASPHLRPYPMSNYLYSLCWRHTTSRLAHMPRAKCSGGLANAGWEYKDHSKISKSYLCIVFVWALLVRALLVFFVQSSRISQKQNKTIR